MVLFKFVWMSFNSFLTLSKDSSVFVSRVSEELSLLLRCFFELLVEEESLKKSDDLAFFMVPKTFEYSANRNFFDLSKIKNLFS
jgi:hypothetical protein